MGWDNAEDLTIYKVVVNHEEYYSIWPAHRENPLGWEDVGFEGRKRECLDYLDRTWTDLRRDHPGPHRDFWDEQKARLAWFSAQPDSPVGPDGEPADGLFEVCFIDENNIWLQPLGKPLPPGVALTGMRGSQGRCYAFWAELIEDPRPLPLEQRIAEALARRGLGGAG